MTERFFIETPTPTGETLPGHSEKGAPCAAYVNSAGATLRWSNSGGLPGIGERVVVTLNRIGPAVIAGYFESEGYVGLMVLPEDRMHVPLDPVVRDSTVPAWRRAGIVCVFGNEIAPAGTTKSRVA